MASSSVAQGQYSNFLADDDEPECPLCLDPLDPQDLQFKPCSCGYQICGFCYHNIKENLNGRCPACRRPYADVEFTPLSPEEVKRLQAAKKQREREKKGQDHHPSSRRNMSNVRVRQRAQVHVQGMSSKMANEDTLPYLRSSEQFGKYGKVTKLFFSRRAPANGVLQPSTSASAHVPVHLYVNYSHPSEAAACIAGVDGTVTSDGHKLKAVWGTTRYCPAYLRGVKCTNENCMQAHEQSEEIDSNWNYHGSSAPSGSSLHHNKAEHIAQQAAADSGTDRAEMRDLKHAWKEQAQSGPQEARPALPAHASWANKPNPINGTSSSSSTTHAPSGSISSRLPKAQNHPLPPRPVSRASSNAASDSGKGKASSRSNGLAEANKPVSSSQVEPAKSGSGPGSTSNIERSRLVAVESKLQPVTNGPPGLATSTARAPPTPPVSEPKGESQSTTNPLLPPGLPVGISEVYRPVTPVSDFERTLGTFGDGLSFQFNLSGSQAGSTLPLSSFETKVPETESILAGEPSRTISASPLPNGHTTSFESDEIARRYDGAFDPFAASTSAPLARAGETNGSVPPGLSRISTATSLAASEGLPSAGLSKPPGLPEPAESTARKSSRFGFARKASLERNSPAPSTGTSIPVTDLFKSVAVNANGHASPIRPGSANSSTSGSLNFILPPGVLNGGAASTFSSAAFSKLPASASDLPLPPPNPSKQVNGQKTSISDLFPGVDLDASFASSSLPPALVKSLGISMDSIDLSASNLNGKLPDLAPIALGQGSSVGNQPLPPSSGPLPPKEAAQQQRSTSSSGPPPGFGAARQAQLAHAQHAQQAHQAQLAAREAQREREAQQQREQQHSHGGHVRPPSAASAGSAGTKDQNSYGFMSMQSPPPPGTPGYHAPEPQRFQDPAIISYAGMNGFGHHHYGHPHHAPYQHHQQLGPLPEHQTGQAGGDFYNRYQPMPVQPQQTYNPYIPVGPVGMGGLGRLPSGPAMSGTGHFGMMRR